MDQSSKKNKSLIFYLIALAVVSLAATIFFIFPDFFLVSEKQYFYAGNPMKLIEVSRETVDSLGELKHCGNWPLNQIAGDNRSRGNPFSKKADSQQIMSATSTVECLGASKAVSQ